MSHVDKLKQLKTMTPWIDIHCHLDRLEGGVEANLQLALEHNIQSIFTIGTEPADLSVVYDLACRYYPRVYCTLGVHPHDGVKYNQSATDYIRQKANEKEVVAVGEIGLDYYYNQSEKKDQLSAFEEQMQIAAEVGLPVEIHTRDAEDDTVEILKKFQGRVTGLIHCFTGTEDLAKKALDLGFNISISGVVTFKNADSLRSIVKNIIPLDRLHVETDSPFLAPVPLRGKTNTSAYMLHTAQVVADLKGISLEELAQQTNENAYKLFSKLQRLKSDVN